MRLPIVFLFLFAIAGEYWLDVGIASTRSSVFVAAIFILFRLKETLVILRTESKTFIIYIYIIIGILINDLYIEADTTDIFKSVFFHIASVINFIFFFSVFSKNDLNFPKYLIIMTCTLIFHKNQEYFFTWSRVLEEPYFQSRMSAIILYFSIGWSFFLMHKSRTLLALLVLLFSCLILYNTGTRSMSYMMIMTLIMSFVTSYTKIKFPPFLVIIVLFIFLIIFGSFLFKPEIINTIIVGRIDTFASLMHFFNTFPFGIGSGGVANLLPYKKTLSSFFGFPLELVALAASSMEYTTAHSFIVGALFKHGVLTLLPLSYFLINIFNLNIKMISFKGVSKEQRLISIFIISYMSYSILFSGYQSFLIQFPLFYAVTLSMFRRSKVVKL